MIYDVKITKGGNLVVKEWNADNLDFAEQIIGRDEIKFNLQSKICLGVGITLRDIFLLLSKDIATFSVVLGCPFLEDILVDGLSEPVITENKKDIAFLELSRVIAIDKGEILWNLDFHGLGEEDSYAVELSPPNEISDLPLILNEDFIVSDIENEKVYLKTKMSYTLQDILIGIIDELSFAGPPDFKAMVLEELKERAKDLDDSKPKGFVEIEDLLDESDLILEKDKKPCRRCGKDSRSDQFDKPNDICDECFELTKEN